MNIKTKYMCGAWRVIVDPGDREAAFNLFMLKSNYLYSIMTNNKYRVSFVRREQCEEFIRRVNEEFGNE